MSERAENEAMTPGQCLSAYADMVFVDHGVFRFVWTARHEIAPGVLRSNQPWPHQLRWAKRQGIRTVVNLRGARPTCGSYILEERACAEQGLILRNFPVSSRDAPRREIVAGARDLFRTIAYPALMHCKSGADRVGFMSVLYLVLEKGEPVARAMRHLSWRYGHFRQAKTGLLDHFFEAYEAYNAQTPIDFMTWVATVYDAEALKAEFMSKWWANILVDRLFRRE